MGEGGHPLPYFNLKANRKGNTMATTLPANIHSIRKIVAERQAYRLFWPASESYPKSRRVLVDGTTANAVLAVHEAAGELQTRVEALIKLSPRKLALVAAIAWSK